VAANVGGDPEQITRRVVDVQLAGEHAAVQSMESVLRERLGPLDLTVSFAETEAVDPAAVVTPHDVRSDDLARIWIDARATERVTLYLVDGKWERVLVRHFRRHENPEVVNEEVGHVVELALVALRGGERIGIGREAARVQIGLDPVAAPPPAPPPVADRPAAPPPVAPLAPAKTRFAAGAFYEAQAYGAGPELWGGPGAVVELDRASTRSRISLGGLLSAQYRLPSEAEGDVVTVAFEGGAARALGVVRTRLTASDELALGVGGGVDLLHTEARGPRSAEVRFAEGRTRWIPAARALVRYDHAVQRLRLFAGIGLDVPFESSRYFLARGGENVALFGGWALRPFFVVGVDVSP